MKKITLLIIVLFSISLSAEDTQIFNFETDFPSTWGTNGNPTNNQYNEDHVNFNIADNPDKTGINTSDKVGKFRRLQSGLWWAYAWFEFTPVYVEATINQPKYVHVSIYKPIVSRVTFQLRNANGSTVYNTGEIHNDKQTSVNEWQDLVYKITTTGNIGFVAIKPDFVNATVSSRLSSDIDIYIDNIYISSDPTPMGETQIPPYEGDLPEDFEGLSTLINPIEYAGDRFGSFLQTFSSTDVSLVDNPLKEGNLSDKCGVFVRKKDGSWNAGFDMIPVSTMTVDATIKYFHIMVYKTMESNINIKLEAGSPVTNTGDIIVTPTASDVNKWTDYVLEIPAAKYSTYGKISLFLDFMQTPAPSERFSEDQLIYFDNIEINNSLDLRIGDVETSFGERLLSSELQAWSDSNGKIHIKNNTETQQTIQILNVTGAVVKTITITTGESIVPMEGSKGVLLLKTTSSCHKLIM